MQAIRTRTAVLDCICLSIVVALSFVLYVGKLGFYSDDWAFLGHFSSSPDQSPLGLLQTIFPETAARPIQSIYLAILFWLFGFSPFFYHVVNNLVFVVGILVLYLALSLLELPRIITLSVPLVFALLPHYSTDRFWIAAFQANLSFTLYAISLYSDLKTVTIRPQSRWHWKIVSVLTLLGSVLAYEVFAPLFVFNVILIWLWITQFQKPISKKMIYVYSAINLFAFALASGYKFLHSERAVIQEDYWSHILRLISNSVLLNYGNYGVGLPLRVVQVLRNYPDKVMILIGVVVVVLIVSLFRHSFNDGKFESFSRFNWFKLLAIGFVVYGLGYSVFLVSSHIAFTPTGINNRTGIAAALGVALTFVGVIGLVSSFLPTKKLQQNFFCLVITFVGISGYLINNAIAQFWIAASREQRHVVAAIRHHFPVLPHDTTLLLDGFCLYVGPGIVFETNWDLGGMLQVYYRDSTLKGDVVNHNLEVNRDGLYTKIYEDRAYYPYSNKLLIYHVGKDQHWQMSDAETASQYFKLFNPDKQKHCGKGQEGFGIAIF